jgi:signal transduction histidine kinase
VLDLSKIEAGQLTLTLEDYDVAHLVDSVVGATAGIAQNKGLELRSEVSKDIPQCLGDQRRLRQVLLNLVGNALKFTDTGGVSLQASQNGSGVLITVTDTGPGIAKADQQRIFEEFQQVDATSTREKGGTGLGLAISKRIVELHGGTISVVSDVGRGSSFEVSLPLRIGETLQREAV